jgi:hypothetical protein
MLGLAASSGNALDSCCSTSGLPAINLSRLFEGCKSLSGPQREIIPRLISGDPLLIASGAAERTAFATTDTFAGAPFVKLLQKPQE